MDFGVHKVRSQYSPSSKHRIESHNHFLIGPQVTCKGEFRLLKTLPLSVKKSLFPGQGLPTLSRHYGSWKYWLALDLYALLSLKEGAREHLQFIIYTAKPSFQEYRNQTPSPIWWIVLSHPSVPTRQLWTFRCLGWSFRYTEWCAHVLAFPLAWPLWCSCLFVWRHSCQKF